MPIVRFGLLLLRRLIVPVIVSSIALVGLFLLFAAAGAPPGWFLFRDARDVIIAWRVALFFMAFTAPAILIVGLPAGYAVAWLRVGRLASLLMIVVIGAVAGALFMAVLFRVPSDEFGQFFDGLLLLGGLPGALTALVWGLCNLDLYRRPRLDGRFSPDRSTRRGSSG